MGPRYFLRRYRAIQHMGELGEMQNCEYFVYRYVGRNIHLYKKSLIPCSLHRDRDFHANRSVAGDSVAWLTSVAG